MERKSNWSEFKMVLDAHNIKKLYHFTDFENLKSIISIGGLFSWKDCDDKGICIPKPGGSPLSRELDGRDGLERYVRLSFTTQHPMMYEAKKDGRLSNPVVLEIDPEVVFWKSTLYSDRNATKNGAQKGDTLDDFKSIHFDSVKALNHFDLDEDEQPFYQAEILVKNFIPLKYITNIGNFGLPIPVQPDVLQSKIPYSAQITRNYSRDRKRLQKGQRGVKNVILRGAKNKRRVKSTTLAIKFATLKDRKVLKRMSFSSFEEEYLEDDWGVVIGKSSRNGKTTISISFVNDEGNKDVAFLSDECKKLVAEGKLDTNKLCVCWYAPTNTEGIFVQVQKKAETFSHKDAEALAAAFKARKNKKA